MINRFFVRLAVAGAFAFGSAAAAEAHAFLDHASPPVGSTVSGPLPEITLWFTEEVEPVFSGVTVTNTAGDRVDGGKVVLDPRNAQELHVALKSLAPGEYEVHWHVVATDTHRTEGNFHFTVASR